MRLIALCPGRPWRTRLLAGLLLLLCIFLLGSQVYRVLEKSPIIELSSLKFRGTVPAPGKAAAEEIINRLNEARVMPAKGQLPVRYKLTVIKNKARITLLFDNPGKLLDVQGQRWLVLPDGGACLENLIEQLEAQSPYGRFLTWPEVDRIFRKYKTARVVDFDTGLAFRVQRRAGRNHADVQPLTKEDSAVMKTIYGGRWSWKRRAVIVEVDGHRIAGSMNGMPHGAGAITGNNFAGHFCIHFRDSQTHSNAENLSHQMMVWKAAGVFDEMLAGAKPGYILQLMLTALEQGDRELASRMFKVSAGGKDELVRKLSIIRWLVVDKDLGQRREKGIVFDLLVSYGLADGTQVKNRQVMVEMVKDSGLIPWKIDEGLLDRLLATPEKSGTAGQVPQDVQYHEWQEGLEM